MLSKDEQREMYNEMIEMQRRAELYNEEKRRAMLDVLQKLPSLPNLNQILAWPAPQAQAEQPAKTVIRIVSRTWTIVGEYTTRLHVSETPDRKHISVRIEKAGKVSDDYVVLTRAAFDSLMALRDEIGERWEADQTLEALGK